MFDGTLVTFVGRRNPPIPKDEVIARLKPFADRSLDLGSTGSGGRVESIALRRLAGDADHDPCLALHLNLRLRNGPHPGDLLPDRGHVGDGLVRAEEPTIPIRPADDLRALPRFRRTPTGVELL